MVISISLADPTGDRPTCGCAPNGMVEVCDWEALASSSAWTVTSIVPCVWLVDEALAARWPAAVKIAVNDDCDERAAMSGWSLAVTARAVVLIPLRLASDMKVEAVSPMLADIPGPCINRLGFIRSDGDIPTPGVCAPKELLAFRLSNEIVTVIILQRCAPDDANEQGTVVECSRTSRSHHRR
jgi:hypothetical protein